VQYFLNVDLDKTHSNWEHLRLEVQQCEGYWQGFVYDQNACLILYRAERLTEQGAKRSVVEFAIHHLFGPEGGSDPEVWAGRLPRQRTEGNQT
jgi:hypothetical protein